MSGRAWATAVEAASEAALDAASDAASEVTMSCGREDAARQSLSVASERNQAKGGTHLERAGPCAHGLDAAHGVL